jgi:hypothetical protein
MGLLCVVGPAWRGGHRGGRRAPEPVAGSRRRGRSSPAAGGGGRDVGGDEEGLLVVVLEQLVLQVLLDVLLDGGEVEGLLEGAGDLHGAALLDVGQVHVVDHQQGFRPGAVEYEAVVVEDGLDLGRERDLLGHVGHLLVDERLVVGAGEGNGGSGGVRGRLRGGVGRRLLGTAAGQTQPGHGGQDRGGRAGGASMVRRHEGPPGHRMGCREPDGPRHSAPKP